MSATKSHQFVLNKSWTHCLSRTKCVLFTTFKLASLRFGNTKNYTALNHTNIYELHFSRLSLWSVFSFIFLPTWRILFISQHCKRWGQKVATYVPWETAFLCFQILLFSEYNNVNFLRTFVLFCFSLQLRSLLRLGLKPTQMLATNAHTNLILAECSLFF